MAWIRVPPKKPKKKKKSPYIHVPTHGANLVNPHESGDIYPGDPYKGQGNPQFKTGSSGPQGGGDDWSAPAYPGSFDFQGKLSRLTSTRDRQIAQLRGMLESRAKGVTDVYNQQLPLIQANYGKAKQSAAAVNDAVANRLATQGSAASADLLARLKAIGAPTAQTDEATKAAADYYQGIGGANYAKDAGDIQRLITRQSEEETLNAKQPGIIRAQLEAEFGSTVADLMEQFMQDSNELADQQDEFQNEKSMWEAEQKQAHQDKLDAIADRDEQRAYEAKLREAEAKEKAYEAEQDRRSEERKVKWTIASKAQQQRLERAWKVQDANADYQHDVDMAKLNYEIDHNKTNQDAAIADAAARRDAALKVQVSAATGATGANKRSGKNKKGTIPTRGSGSQTTRGQAYKSAYDALYTKKKGEVLIRGHLDTDNKKANAINSALRGAGIDPWGPEGTAIRKSLLQQANGVRRQGTQRRYVAPKYTKPGQKATKTKIKGKVTVGSRPAKAPAKKAPPKKKPPKKKPPKKAPPRRRR